MMLQLGPLRLILCIHFIYPSAVYLTDSGWAGI